MNDDWNLTRRIKNMVWTVSENYQSQLSTNSKIHEYYTDIQVFDPLVLYEMGLDKEEVEALSIYSASHQGAHKRLTNVKVLSAFLTSRIKSGFDEEKIFSLVHIGEDLRVDALMEKERPGCRDFRLKGTHAIMNKLFSTNGSETEKLFKAIRLLVNEIDGTIDCDWKMAHEIYEDLLKCSFTKDTLEMIHIIDDIYLKYWSSGLPKYFFLDDIAQLGNKFEEASMDGDCEDKPSKGNGENSDKQDSSDATAEISTQIYDEGNKSDSGEINPSASGDIRQNDEKNLMNSNIHMSSNSDNITEEEIRRKINHMLNSTLLDSSGDKDSKGEEIKKKLFLDMSSTESEEYSFDDLSQRDRMEYYYGKSLYTKEDTIHMQKQICRGCHSGFNIHFTDGAIRAYNSNDYQKQLVERQKKTNYEIYERNKLIHSQHIQKLSNMLIDTLKSAKDPDAYISDFGSIIPNKIWKATRTNNSRIFNRVDFSDPGEYVVDVLLDASGSQSDRQPLIAKQGYILAEALFNAGIPARVSSFCNFSNYTIMRRFRDYENDKNSNMNIFEYVASGNNRDGLAIQATSYELCKRHETNKILIVLSDGQPADNSQGSNEAMSFGGIMNYDSMLGVEDTAQQIRKIRGKGILVLGVYTGPKANLEAEKLMYGSDFAYINDINYFADIVGKYLKKHIENSMY